MAEGYLHYARHLAFKSEVGAVKWGEALNALHAFAQITGAPAGADVVEWFSARTEEYRKALTFAVRKPVIGGD